MLCCVKFSWCGVGRLHDSSWHIMLAHPFSFLIMYLAFYIFIFLERDVVRGAAVVRNVSCNIEKR